MRIMRVFTYVLPMLACVLAPVAAQGNSTSVFDRLQSSWSSALGSAKSAIDDLHSALSSAIGSPRIAPDNPRASVPDAINSSNDALEEKDRGIPSSSVSTSPPTTATPANQTVTYRTNKVTEAPSTTRNNAHSVTPTATSTGPPPDNITAPTSAVEPSSASRWVYILRALLGAGMLACVGLFCCREKSLSYVMVFLLLLSMFLLITPTSDIVDNEPATFLTNWNLALFVSTMVIVYCVSCCKCEKQAPYFITFYLIVLDVLLLYWRSVIYWFFGIVIIGIVIGIIVINGGLYFVCCSERCSSQTTWSHDSYGYERPAPVASVPNLRVNVRSTPSTTRTKSPPYSAPVAAVRPLLDERHAYVGLGRAGGLYETEEGSIWRPDFHNYRNPEPIASTSHLNDNVRYTPAETPPKTPPSPCPGLVAKPLLDDRHSDVEFGRMTQPYEAEEGPTWALDSYNYQSRGPVASTSRLNDTVSHTPAEKPPKTPRSTTPGHVAMPLTDRDRGDVERGRVSRPPNETEEGSKCPLGSQNYHSPSPIASVSGLRDNLRNTAATTTRPNTPPNPETVAVPMPPLDDQPAVVEPDRENVSTYEIKEGSTGHTYRKIFGPYINASLTSVTIEESYLYKRCHFDLLKEFLKTLLEDACNLREVIVKTQRATDDNEEEQERRRALQERTLTEIKRWVESTSVSFRWEYEEFHDRWIRLDNGWKMMIGRGLDFYHPPSGTFDRRLARRRCRGTTVIFVPVKK